MGQCTHLLLTGCFRWQLSMLHSHRQALSHTHEPTSACCPYPVCTGKHGMHSWRVIVRESRGKHTGTGKACAVDGPSYLMSEASHHTFHICGNAPDDSSLCRRSSCMPSTWCLFLIGLTSETQKVTPLPPHVRATPHAPVPVPTPSPFSLLLPYSLCHHHLVVFAAFTFHSGPCPRLHAASHVLSPGSCQTSRAPQGRHERSGVLQTGAASAHCTAALSTQSVYSRHWTARLCTCRRFLTRPSTRTAYFTSPCACWSNTMSTSWSILS